MVEPVILPLSDCVLAVCGLPLSEAQALRRRLGRTGTWLEVVQGLDSVCVTFDPYAEEMASARARLDAQLAEDAPAEAGGQVEAVSLTAVYGGEAGPDLSSVGRRLGMTEDEIIEAHTSCTYDVAMVGFTPGFAYLHGTDQRLTMPRLAEPRLRVPAGSIAIAGGLTGIYPVQSPGGWSIIGRTSGSLFDPASEEPFTLRPGARVRFKLS